VTPATICLATLPPAPVTTSANIAGLDLKQTRLSMIVLLVSQAKLALVEWTSVCHVMPRRAKFNRSPRSLPVIFVAQARRQSHKQLTPA